jgi:hypothetical protein
MVRQTRKTAIVNSILGKASEPKYEKLESQSDIASALNWYNANKDAKASAKYIAEYAKKNKIKGKLDTSKTFQSTGFICRMISNGTIVAEELAKQTRDKVIELLSKDELDEVEDDSNVAVVSIQERMKEKVSEIAGDLEGAIDDYILSNFTKAPSPYGVMHGRVKGKHAKMLVPIFENIKNQFQEVLDTEDKDLKEGYSNFSRVELKKLVSFCNQIIDDAMKLGNEAKTVKKPKRRK